jgi:Outer membrane protein beta-barrel domain
MDMRSFVTATLVSAGLLAAAVPAAAQAPGIELKLNPRIGMYVPVTDLGEAASEVYELNNSLAIGLGAELQLAALPFGIRANLDYATGSTVSLDGVEDEDTEATLLAVVGDLVFRPLPNLILFQPYIFAGGGLKQYDFQVEGAGDFPSESDPTVHLGFGLDLGFGPLDLNAELGDYISWFELTEGSDESEMQHDLFVTVGFAIGLL